MLRLGLLWLLLMLSLAGCYSSGKQPPTAKHGILHLKSETIAQADGIKLAGEWEFYWKQLLPPRDFLTSPAPVPTGMIEVGSPWNGYLAPEGELPGDGFATYRLQLFIAGPNATYGLKLPNQSSAYRLWINGQPVVESGKVGTSKDSMKPMHNPQVVTFSSQSKNEIILQVSNFHHRKGGFWNNLELGDAKEVNKRQQQQKYLSLFILGTLLIMAVYHLGLFILRPKDKSTLYFGLFCFVYGLRTVLYREMVFLEITPVDLDWEAVNTLRYMSSFAAMPLFMLFTHSLYPHEFCKYALWLLLAMYGGLLAYVVFNDAKDYSPTMQVHQFLTISYCLYVFYVLYRAIHNQREAAKLFLFGFIVMFVSIANDILSDNGVIDTDFRLTLGVFVFVFTQAFILSMRFTNAFTRIGHLTTAYERFVPKQFLEHLQQEDIVKVKLGDHAQREMSVLFCDIRSFTSLSESMTPQQNFNFLNAYLGRMEPVITRHHGFIDKYIGDMIMALFDRNADDAVLAGIGMLEALREYNDHRSNISYVPLRIGIGINHGNLMLGTVGGEQRMETTVISDTVNLASRLETLTKHYDIPLLISRQTLEALADPTQYHIRLIDRVQVYGKLEMIELFEVFDADPPELRKVKQENTAVLQQVIDLQTQCKMQEALHVLQAAHARTPEDPAVDPALRIRPCTPK